MKSITLSSLAILFAVSQATSAQATDFTYETLVKKLAFGSGNNQKKDDSHWKAVNTELPNIWVWLGEVTETTFAGIKAKKKAYDKVLASVGYQEIRSRSQILGVWDEEDAKMNREKNRQPFLEFISEPFESARFKRDALFASYMLGPKDKRIKLILLDTFVKRDKASHVLLGADQWTWLEQELNLEKENPQVLVIGSPIPFLGKGQKKRTWSDYEADKKRLLDLISKLSMPVYIISGHNNFGEFSALELTNGKLLNEITSSGLNIPKSKAPANEHRVGEAITKRNFGILEFIWPAAGSGNSPTEETVKVNTRIQAL